jgi:hypothetical protein
VYARAVAASPRPVGGEIFDETGGTPSYVGSWFSQYIKLSSTRVEDEEYKDEADGDDAISR